MATLYPSWNAINNGRPLPTDGERKLLEFLDEKLTRCFTIRICRGAVDILMYRFMKSYDGCSSLIFTH